MRPKGKRDLVWEPTGDGRWTQIPYEESTQYLRDVERAAELSVELQLVDEAASKAARAAARGDVAPLIALIGAVDRKARSSGEPN